jgi:triacylglycerol lipase
VAGGKAQEWGYELVGELGTDAGHTQYLIATSKDVAILAFRGTEPEQFADWATDAECALVPCPWKPSLRVHQGFSKALETVWKPLNDRLRPVAGTERALWITGHSLGGALAVLAAHRFADESGASRVAGVYTFGQPRCGDQAFKEDLERGLAGRLWRVVNNRDVVPRVPPAAMGYRHAGTLIYIDELGRIVLNPPFWFQLLDTMDLPSDAAEAKRTALEGVKDHDCDTYVSLLAAGAVLTS